MAVIDVGASLRNARKKKGLSLSELANKTKISVGMLQALEMNDVAKLPGDIFARGFLRAYAREVGLDPEDTVEAYLDQFAPVTEGAERADARSARTRGETTTADALEDQRSQGAFPTDVRLQTFVGVLVVIMLVSFFVLRGREDTESGPRPDVAEASAGSDVAHAAAPAPAPPPEATPAKVPGEPGEVLRLEANPTAQCWVSIATDGGRPVSRLLEAGERTTIEFRQDVTLRIGDAAAFSYSIDGAPGRVLGGSGEPVTVSITRETYREFLGGSLRSP